MGWRNLTAKPEPDGIELVPRVAAERLCRRLKRLRCVTKEGEGYFKRTCCFSLIHGR